MDITIHPVTFRDCTHLAYILRSDEVLRASLGSTARPTAGQFQKSILAWMNRQGGQTSTILHRQEPVGLISASTGNLPRGHVRIGYWLSSEHWGKGNGSRAFGIMLDSLYSKGFRTAMADIPRDSAASLMMWQRYGAGVTDIGKHVRVTLSLPQREIARQK